MANKKIVIPDPETLPPDMFEAAGMCDGWSIKDIHESRVNKLLEGKAASEAENKKKPESKLDQALAERDKTEEKIRDLQQKLEKTNAKIKTLLALEQ